MSGRRTSSGRREATMYFSLAQVKKEMNSDKYKKLDKIKNINRRTGGVPQPPALLSGLQWPEGRQGPGVIPKGQ